MCGSCCGLLCDYYLKCVISPLMEEPDVDGKPLNVLNAITIKSNFITKESRN